MARTKRTIRTHRLAVVKGRLERLKASALSTAGTLMEQGTTGLARARLATTDAATRFERAFETRVSKAMSRMGVPSAREVRSLSRQVAQLQQRVEQLRRSRARA